MYTERLSQVMTYNTERYMGCIIRKEGIYYYVGSKPYDSLEQAKQAIDESIKSLNNSIC